MRTSTLCIVIRVLCGVLQLAGLSTLALADGTGRIATPYSIHDKLDLKTITANKDLVDNQNMIAMVSHGDQSIELTEAHFSLAVPHSTSPLRQQALVGTLNGKYWSVAISQLKELNVVQQDAAHNRTLCDVVVFPTLTPAQLLAMQPTYTQLKRFSATRRVWFDASNPKSYCLTLIGEQWVNEGYTKTRMQLSSLAEATRIIIKPDWDQPVVNWWSIPSVTDDPSYSRHHKPLPPKE